MDKPIKKTLAKLAADAIRKEILEGNFLGTLPSEHTLASHLQVSRRTVRKALAQLELENLLFPPIKGARRMIRTEASTKTQKRKKHHKVAFLSRYQQTNLHASGQDFYRALRLRLENSQISLDYIFATYSVETKNIRHIENLLKSSNYNLWVVYEITAALAELFEREKIPYIAVGNLEPIPFVINEVAFTMKPSIVHAFQLFLSLGHESISWLCGRNPHYQEVKDLYSRHKLDYERDHIFHPHESTKTSFLLALEKCFSKTSPPTALIVSTEHLATTISWLAQSRLKIPDDVSLINFGTDPLLEQLVPQVSYYCTHFQQLANRTATQVAALCDSPQRPRQQEMLISEFHPGKSHGPPKRKPPTKT